MIPPLSPVPLGEGLSPTSSQPSRRPFSRSALLSRALTPIHAVAGAIKGGSTAIKNVVKDGTYGALLLQRHVTELLRDELNIDIRFEQFPTDISREFRSLEKLSAYLRWLRGCLCILGVASFVLSLLVILMDDVSLSWVILLLSLAAQVILVQTYSVKATVAGLTNSIYRGKANVWFSPYCYQMIGEMLFWCIQCPPTLESTHPVNMLGFVVFGRVYSLVLYMNNATWGYRTFCRAMSVMVGVPLSNSFFVRASLIYRKAQTITVIVSCCWLTLALMFSKSEDIPYRDAMWFIFVTVGTIGYGDISPVTILGRLTAFLAWVFALICIGYAVVLTHDTLALKEHERTMYLLFRSNSLAANFKDQAATTIQTCWRFYLSKKKGNVVFTQNFLAWSLSDEVDRFQKCRLLMRDAVQRFRDYSDKVVGTPSIVASQASTAEAYEAARRTVAREVDAEVARRLQHLERRVVQLTSIMKTLMEERQK